MSSLFVVKRGGNTLISSFTLFPSLVYLIKSICDIPHIFHFSLGMRISGDEDFEDDFENDFEEDDDGFDDNYDDLDNNNFDSDFDEDFEEDDFDNDLSEDDVSYFIDDEGLDDGDKGDDEYFYGEYDE